MTIGKLLDMLLEAIDYSFLQTDGSYDKTLTYPVIDKIQYIKEQVKNIGVKEVDLDKILTEFMSRYSYENGGEYPSAIDIAEHFYTLGLVQKEE